MNIKFAVEPLESCWHEIYNDVDGLAFQHWNETQSYKNQKYSPSFERYNQYAKAGWFIQATCRDDGRLVGYSGNYLTPSMHSQCLIAVEDTWFLLPEYRKGWNAIKFYKFIENYCAALGAVEATLTIPDTKDDRLGRMLERLAYTPVSRQYSKKLEHRADSANVPNDVAVTGVSASAEIQ